MKSDLAIAKLDLLQARNRLRDDARTPVELAKLILSQTEDSSLDVAAMRLRQALECLTYEYATVYLDELTEQDLAIWQPQRLMERLMEIDPLAGMDLEISIQDPATAKWLSLGNQFSLNIKDIKRSYTRLSRIIHRPSIADLLSHRENLSGEHRQLCLSVVKRLDRVLASTIWNVALPTAGFINFECSECGVRVRRRLTALVEGPKKQVDAITADCPKCPASFEIVMNDKHEAFWSPNPIRLKCPNPKCSHEYSAWKRGISENARSDCPACRESASIKRIWVLARTVPS